MKVSLRVKFMGWLMAHTAVIYLVMGFGLLLFNQHEIAERPEEAAEEKEELLILYAIMLAVLPVAVGGAWFVTRRVLRPLQSMLEVADQISAGRIEQRLETPVATDELGHLARTLNSAFDNYHRLLARVDRFSLDAAHQLRNPLAAMRASAEVCLQQPRSSEEYGETLARILDESRRLGHTVDQLLLLARLTRDVPGEAFEQVDLARLVGGLVESLCPAFEERRLRLEVSLPAAGGRMRGSPRLLEQAVANLLDNSLRITPEGGHVLVELTVPVAGRLSLSVADSGPGLSGVIKPGPLSLERPVAEPNNHKEGTGLGLLIVCNIAHAHGGSVQASVSQWNGARFTIELPALG